MKLKSMIARYPEAALFALAFALRYAWKAVSGAGPFALFGDAPRYDILSDRILQGNFNLDYTAFVVAPLYPFFLAGTKLLAGAHWIELATLLQIALVSWSVVVLYRMALLLFGDKRIALAAGLLYVVYPPTLWLNFTLSQETVFQSLFILFTHYFLRTLKGNPHSLLPAALLYAAAFLTKSHVLLLFPFLVLLLFLPFGATRLHWVKVPIFVLLALLPTLPMGLYYLRTQGVYVVSTTGYGSFLHQYNSEQAYREAFQPFDPVTGKRDMASNFIFHKDYHDPDLGRINNAPLKERDKLHLKAALLWIERNPQKFMELKLFALQRFLLPGLSPTHHASWKVWAVLVFSLPVYLFGYLGMFRHFHIDRRAAAYGVSVLGVVFLFYMIFGPQHRFRSITLDPLLCVFAPAGFLALRHGVLSRRKR